MPGDLAGRLLSHLCSADVPSLCIGLASTALVLSIAVPFGGSKWYLLTGLSPLAGVYYWQRGTRQEEIQVKIMSFVWSHQSHPVLRFSTALTCPCPQVKMVTSDDELVTDITVRICLIHKLLRTLYCRGADCEEFLLVARGCKPTQKSVGVHVERW